MNRVDWERDTLTDHADRPRLLLLVTTNQRRGAEVFGEQLAGGLAQRGWDVSFRSLVRGDGPIVSATPLIDKDRAALGGADLDVARALRAEAQTHDLVFANGSATLRYGLATRLMRKRPKLIYGSIGEPLAWAVNPLTRLRTSTQMKLTDLVTAVSAPTRMQIVSGLKLAGDKVVVASTGVDPAFSNIVAEPSTGTLRLLLLGAVTQEKGPDVAIRMVQKLAERRPVALRIVGRGELAESLQASLRPDDPIELTGPTDDVRPHLAWADALLLTSRTEGLPGVVLEAAAAAVPAVAFDVGGVSDIVQSGVTGHLVARGDEAAMLAVLDEIAADPARLPDLGRAAQELVLERFTLDHAFDRYDDVFRSVVAGRRPKTLAEV